MSWVGREDFISAVLFYQFSSSATEPPDPTILDQAMNGSLYGSNVSITIDGNGAPHVAWSKKVGLNNYEDIFYCWRDANGNWQQIRNISEQSNAQSVCPHIDDYGDYLSAVWWYDGDYEIWLRQKYIPDDWEDKIPYSQEYAICNYPVNAAVDFSVWCETPSNQSDIRYHSNSYNWGWVSQASKNEYFCHSQLQRDWSPWDLYTIFTKGDEIPYRIISTH
jgi:hypothetical protein